MRTIESSKPKFELGFKIKVILTYLTLSICHLLSMHPLYSKAANLTETIIAAAIDVHRDKGPGLIESIYEWSLVCEFGLRKLSVENQRQVTIEYKGFKKEEPLRFDLLVEGCVLIETKSVSGIMPIHQAQLLSYMKLLNIPIGLLINFNVSRLVEGVHRMVLPGANRP